MPSYHMFNLLDNAEIAYNADDEKGYLQIFQYVARGQSLIEVEIYCSVK